jgi:protoporphyrinogen oxidase
VTIGASASSRVAVVGAGLAGLRAAHHLADRGHRVSIFEARARAGGRLAGEWHEGHWMDTAWPLVGARDRLLARWVLACGLADEMWPLRPVQTTLLRAARTTPIDALSLLGASRLLGGRLQDRMRLLRWGRLAARHAPLLDPVHPERAASLDFRSVADHVNLYFGSRALERWLAPELQALWGDSVEALSRVALLQHARSVGIGESRPGGPGLPRRPLAELVQVVCESLELHRGVSVERLDEEPAGGFRLETIDADGARAAHDFEAVVVATGPQEAARIAASLLTPAERDFFAATRERPTACVAVAIAGVQGGLPQEIRIPRSEGSAFSSLVIEPGQIEGRAPEGDSQLVALARDGVARRWTEVADDVVEKNAANALAQTIPDLGSRVKFVRVERSRLPLFEVGHYRRLDAFQQVQRDRRSLGRRLYWAGDYLSGAGFEAAVTSGWRAALSLDRDLHVGDDEAGDWIEASRAL